MPDSEFESTSIVKVVVAFGIGGMGAMAGGALGYMNRQGILEGIEIIGGAIIGLLIGSILGIAVSLFIPSYTEPETGRTTSRGPQLVGQHCVICRMEITSILEGEFCLLCRAPNHHKCIPETIDAAGDRCPRCGSLPEGE